LRTHAEMHFFAAPSDSDPLEKRHEVLIRILTVYAKHHPEVQYAQGMNELLAPIYFVFCQSDDVGIF